MDKAMTPFTIVPLPGRQILPDITQVLTSGAHNAAGSDDMMATACHTIRNLVVSNPESAKGVMGNNVLSTLRDLSRNGYGMASYLTDLITMQLHRNGMTEFLNFY